MDPATAILSATTLNPQQRQAASFGDDPLLIIAGAGTGKTNTLAHRVACLIHQSQEVIRCQLEPRARHSDPVNRTGILGGPIQREDGAHGTTTQVFPGAA